MAASTIRCRVSVWARGMASDWRIVERVVPHREAGAAPGGLDGRAGAERDIAVAVEIVGVRLPAAGLREHLPAAAAAHLRYEPLGRPPGHLDARRVAPAGGREHADDVAGLVLDQRGGRGAAVAVGGGDGGQVWGYPERS